MTATEPVGIAVVGLGKIARDQHVPEIAASPAFTLAATVDPVARLEGVEGYGDLDALLAALKTRAVRDGVRGTFGVTLVNEPVLVDLSL